MRTPLAGTSGSSRWSSLAGYAVLVRYALCERPAVESIPAGRRCVYGSLTPVPFFVSLYQTITSAGGNHVLS
jgi:hypothetical protein